MYHQFKEAAGVDIEEPMEVGPTCHYVMGGVRVDADTTAAAGLSGLFAAGEVAGGMHGSNRLGGNSLSDLLVFGRRAGHYAAEHARAAKGTLAVDARQVEAAVQEVLAPVQRRTGENPTRSRGTSSGSCRAWSASSGRSRAEGGHDADRPARGAGGPRPASRAA